MKKSIFSFLFLFFVSISLYAQSGKYLDLDGVNRYMSIPHHTDFNFSTSQEYTITYWVYAKAYVTNARMVSKRGTSTASDKSGYELWGTNSSTQFYAVNANSTSASVFSAWGSGTGALNTWIHMAFVVSGTGSNRFINLYQDGTLVKTSSAVSTYAVSNAFDVLVGKTNYTSGYLNARIDNLRFYNKALSAAEITADKTSTVTASTPNLVAAYDFENNTQTSASDITGLHNATLYNFPVMVNITGETITKETTFTGRGNDNEQIIKAVLTTTGTDPAPIQNVVVNTGSGTTNISDIESIKIYSTGSSTTFDSRNPTGTGATLLGTATPAATGNTTITCSGDLISAAQNVLWITYKIKDTAAEGNKVDASFISIKTANQTYNVTNTSPTGTREILLRRKLIFTPGDYSSTNYRIPAIITAHDNSLVTLTDKRKYNSSDLPEDIDIVCRRSTDNGVTWGAPVTVALGTARYAGFGDAVLIKTNTVGKLVALFVGGQGLSASTPSNPIRSYMSKSTDNGITWTTPVDITSQIFGSGCSDATRKTWYASFFGSGNGLCLTRGTKAGRIMAVAAIREVSGGPLNNYAIYSDDEGTTWKVSNRAISSGDEAKVTQLNNGDVLMSSRASTRIWAKSTDGGVTWGAQSTWSQLTGNPTNGDMVHYTAMANGFDKNRILHTIPNASDRSNLTMFLSTDEGVSWGIKKTICAGTSAYSSIAILPDGTIGVYQEEDGSVPYKMYFINFSLNWLTNGADTYYPAGATAVATPVISLAAGTYPSPQTITLSTTTSGASIYYTLDGSTPNSGSSLYSGAIQLTTSCTLKAIAIKSGSPNSEIASAIYRIGDYLVNTDPGEALTRTDRHLDVVKFTGNSGGTMTATLPTATKYVYNDMTSVVGLAKPGEMLTPTMTYTGNYMHGYVYLDYGNDGVFSYNINSDGTPAAGSDIVSYSYYSGKNSLGVTTANNNPGVNSPVFTLPSSMEPGFYRMRYKVDWDNIDAGGNISSGNRITANGGGMVDVLLNVHNANVTVTTSATNGSIKSSTNTEINNTLVAFNNALTITLTPNSGNKLTSLTIKHGYLTKDEIVHGNRQWKIETIDVASVVNNKYTIPAAYVDGDVKITAVFSIATGVDNTNNDSALKIKANKNLLSVTALKSTDVRISDITGRTYFSGNIAGERNFSLKSGVYLVNNVKVLVP